MARAYLGEYNIGEFHGLLHSGLGFSFCVFRSIQDGVFSLLRDDAVFVPCRRPYIIVSV